MYKVFFIYLSSCILFWVNRPPLFPGPYNYRKSSPQIYPPIAYMEKRFLEYKNLREEDRNYGTIVLGFLTGNRRFIPKKMLQSYKTLNLYHLFTPSGLHLGSLLGGVGSVFGLISSTWKKGMIYFSIAFLTWSFFPVSGYYSLKRMLAFRIHQVWVKKWPLLSQKWGTYEIFLLTFGLDFLWGTYRDSPLSFCYSYIFLGCILACAHKSQAKMLVALMGGQILCAYLNRQSLYLPGLLFNFWISTLFTLFFPIFCLCVLFPGLSSFLFPISIVPFHYIVEKSAQIYPQKFSFIPDGSEVLLIFCLSLPFFQGKIRPILFALYLIFQCSSLNSGPSFLQRPRFSARKGGHLSSFIPDSKIYSRGKHTYKLRYEQIQFYGDSSKTPLWTCKHWVSEISYSWVCKGKRKRLRLKYRKKIRRE